MQRDGRTHPGFREAAGAKLALVSVLSFVFFLMSCASSKNQAPSGLTAAPFSVTASPQLTIASPVGPGLPDAVIGRTYSMTFEASGASGTLTWSNPGGTLGAGSCAGLGLSSSGTLTGTPAGAAGTCSFTVQVADSGNNSAMADFTVTVQPALAVNAIQLGDGVQDRPFRQAFNVTGGIMPLTSCEATAALPAGLSLNASGSQCVVSGTPQVAAGLTQATLTVTDSSNAATAAGSAMGNVSVQIHAPLAITAPSRMINGMVGFPYPGVSFTATGGTGSGYTWTQAGAASASGLCSAGGTMPAGLTIAATSGTISGVPTAASVSAGDFPFQVCVEDEPTASTAAGALVSSLVVLNVLNRYAYIATGGQKILVLDLGSNTVVGSIPLNQYANPLGVAVTPDGRYAFAADNSLNQIIVVDTITNQQITGSPFALPSSCQGPWDVVISPDPTKPGANRAFISCSILGGQAVEEVVVLDTTNPGAPPLAVIPTGDGSIPASLAIRKDNSRVYVTLNGTDQLFMIDNTQAVPTPVASPFFALDPTSEQPMGIAVADHAGKIYAYVGKDDPDQSHAYEGIEVVDVTSDSPSLVTMLSFPAGSINIPTNAAVDPGGALVYFTLMAKGQLAVVDNSQPVPAFVSGSPFNLPDTTGKSSGYAYGVTVPAAPSGDPSVYVTLFCPETIAVLSGGTPPSDEPASPVSVPADGLIFNIKAVPVPR